MENIEQDSMKKRWLNLRISLDLLERLDRWRHDEAQRDNRDISRSEAIRVLVSKGIAE